jgi:hypothetical protein
MYVLEVYFPTQTNSQQPPTATGETPFLSDVLCFFVCIKRPSLLLR